MDESCDCESTKIEAETRKRKQTRNRVKLCNGGSMYRNRESDLSSRNSSSSTSSKSQNC